MYTIYTDGAYSSSSNTGGASAIITQDGKIIKKLYLGYRNTTNNRMELMGVLMSLEYFKSPQELEIYSDSSYVVNSINQNNNIKALLIDSLIYTSTPNFVLFCVQKLNFL